MVSKLHEIPTTTFLNGIAVEKGGGNVLSLLFLQIDILSEVKLVLDFIS